MSGQTKEALEEYQRVLELKPGLPGVHEAIGDIQSEAADYARAERSYESELAISPENAGGNYRYGSVLLKQDRTREAMPFLRAAVESDPSIRPAHYQLGKALLDEGNVDAAETSLLNAIAPNAPEQTLMSAHYQLSQLYRRQGRTAEANQHRGQFQELQRRKQERTIESLRGAESQRRAKSAVEGPL